MDRTARHSGFLTGFLTAYESFKPADARQYGVKGMKWGVRKPDGSPPGPASEVVATQKAGKRVKTAGGTGRTASEDAVKAAVSKQVAKKSTTDALSNQELQQLVQRMQLEANFKRLSADDKTAGQKFIQRFFFNQQKREQDLKNIESLYGAGATVVAAAAVGRDIKNMKL